ncbi:hypothetical protein TTHERM_000192139 (macronuclear) [Tetrahymena thermophila SB210]|uniref:Uncharacterized protein n=1 Tax=Tetrahymena thermophila (strain SB210) TaxID=312017 RepID=W7XA89_TETTS|nr:hypothetical protein TTHERM_000192139 [Tetrahymena thermophila SB210]EWS74267.1 hypothetical protein TTHERM_000192139 [Tetrahymena thermophila SB210]|eukprot:XP_012653240.1 hypothetical protein TTHERM_000192139 [Tetrahymena thermophila SB210]
MRFRLIKYFNNLKNQNFIRVNFAHHQGIISENERLLKTFEGYSMLLVEKQHSIAQKDQIITLKDQFIEQIVAENKRNLAQNLQNLAEYYKILAENKQIFVEKDQYIQQIVVEKDKMQEELQQLSNLIAQQKSQMMLKIMIRITKQLFFWKLSIKIQKLKIRGIKTRFRTNKKNYNY